MAPMLKTAMTRMTIIVAVLATHAGRVRAMAMQKKALKAKRVLKVKLLKAKRSLLKSKHLRLLDCKWLCSALPFLKYV